MLTAVSRRHCAKHHEYLHERDQQCRKYHCQHLRHSVQVFCHLQYVHALVLCILLTLAIQTTKLILEMTEQPGLTTVGQEHRADLGTTSSSYWRTRLVPSRVSLSQLERLLALAFVITHCHHLPQKGTPGQSRYCGWNLRLSTPFHPCMHDLC